MKESVTMTETREEWKARIGTGPAIAASAVPSRRGMAAGERARTKRWEREHDATRTLAKHGVKVDNLREAPEKLRRLGG